MIPAFDDFPVNLQTRMSVILPNARVEWGKLTPKAKLLYLNILQKSFSADAADSFSLFVNHAVEFLELPKDMLSVEVDKTG